VIASLGTGFQVGATLVLGFVTGVLSGMFGIGGAVVSNPGLRALGATPLEAIGSTLPSIFPSSITGTLRYHRDGFVRWRAVGVMGAFGVAASVGGALLADLVPGDGHLLLLLLAGLIAFTAYRIAFPRVAPAAVGAGVQDVGVDPRLEWWRLGVIGLSAGGLSGLLGIGGGILMVPALSGWARLGLKETIATSLAVVGILAVPGTIAHAALGHIVWSFAIPLSIGVIPGARIGAHITISASDRALRVTVGSALAVLALVYAVGELIALAD
jgi:uncharacterized membrane protein YfcA